MSQMKVIINKLAAEETEAKVLKPLIGLFY